MKETHVSTNKQKFLFYTWCPGALPLIPFSFPAGPLPFWSPNFGPPVPLRWTTVPRASVAFKWPFHVVVETTPCARLDRGVAMSTPVIKLNSV